MLLAYHQRLDPLHDLIPGSAIVSTLFAALPVLVLFWLLVPRRWLASKAGAAGAAVAIVIAVVIYGMPADMAVMSFASGAAFGLLPVGWTIFSAMLLYNITVETGQFTVVRRSVAGLSGDARIQAVLIGFAFGAFLEGAAGGGTPVAICGAIMVGLGFHPLGGIHQQHCARSMREPGDAIHVGNHARDVRAARDSHQLHPPFVGFEAGLQVG